MAKKDQTTKVEDPKVLDVTAAPEVVEQAPEAAPEVVEQAPEAAPEVVEQAPEAAPEVVEQAPVDETVYVTVTVPKAFKLRLTHDLVVDYAAGICEMPVEHAQNWYSVANGVTIYKK